jgi:hypothetical protein
VEEGRGPSERQSGEGAGARHSSSLARATRLDVAAWVSGAARRTLEAAMGGWHVGPK